MDQWIDSSLGRLKRENSLLGDSIHLNEPGYVSGEAHEVLPMTRALWKRWFSIVERIRLITGQPSRFRCDRPKLCPLVYEEGMSLAYASEFEGYSVRVEALSAKVDDGAVVARYSCFRDPESRRGLLRVSLTPVSGFCVVRSRFVLGQSSVFIATVSDKVRRSQGEGLSWSWGDHVVVAGLPRIGPRPDRRR